MTNTIPASAIVSVLPNVISAGGSSLVMNGLVLTKSSRVPIGTVQAFANPNDVGAFFGLASHQFAVAEVYFAGFDTSTVKPAQMLFVQYPALAVPAYVRGGNISGLSLAALQALSGTLIVTMDGYTRTAGSVSLSAATSFSSAAGIIQTALNASPATEATFTAAIAGTAMTVSAVASGALAIGQTVTGGATTANSIILAQVSGTTGGDGVYTLSQSSTVSSMTLTTTPTALAVTYDSVSGAFVATSGVSGAASTASFFTGTLSATLLLTSATGAILSQGAAAATPGAFMTGVTMLTQNWATFFTDFDPDGGSGNTVKEAFGLWTTQQNNRYAYICADTDITPTETVPATSSLGYIFQQGAYSGICLIYEPSDLLLAAFISGAAASINFTATNGRITFAFKSQAGLTASATDQTTADNLLENGYNFYGAYATANDEFIWFYNGQVSGKFSWLDSFINQIWLNNALQLAIMQLFANTNAIPYNAAGNALIEAACADPINAAVNFGAINPGVALSNAQIAEVNAAAGTNIAGTLQTRGWYLQVLTATAIVRGQRGSPPCNFWYVDGGSVQKIVLNSTEVQ